jgi:signal transduction histidine kinase
MQLAAGRMRILISDLLSFSKVNMEQTELELVNLNEVKEQALFSLKAAVDEKEASIKAHDLPVVQGISFQLQQLFENVIGNAVKYCEPGITPVVNITCNKVLGGEKVGSGLHSERVYYQICFKDNGIGFEQQYADKIFELFQRLHNKSEYPGTGLGLAICKKIVQNHGGHIQAISEPGEGSVFEIFLPAIEL